MTPAAFICSIFRFCSMYSVGEIPHATAICLSSSLNLTSPTGRPVAIDGLSLDGGALTGGPPYCRTGAALRSGGDAGAAVGVGAGAGEVACPLPCDVRP